MLKSIITIALLVGAFALRAQDTTTVANNDSRPAIYWLYHNNYNMAIRYNDYAEAKTALYNLINIDPQNDSLRFNLAYLYFDNQQYASSILVCRDLLARNPQNTAALEMSAIAYEELGLKDKAMANYEQLYLVTENLETLYKLAYLQYELKRYNESKVNIDILLANPEIDNRKMIFQIDDLQQKEYSLRVAVLNLNGLLKKAEGDQAGARESFNKALELAPDFVFAKDNLAELDK